MSTTVDGSARSDFAISSLASLKTAVDTADLEKKLAPPKHDDLAGLKKELRTHSPSS